MSALTKIREFIETYPGAEVLRDFQVDFLDQVPTNGSLAPSGLVEVNRKRDILGNVTIKNQYNFGLYCVFVKAPGDDVGATINADWVMDFQEWVQTQSALGKAPVFGDVPEEERIAAQNGVLFAAYEEGTAVYMIQLSVEFTKKFEVN